MPVIVTNKHVLNGNLTASYYVTLATSDGMPAIGKMARIEIANLPNAWIGHPDPKVDLAIIPIAESLRQFAQQRVPSFIVHLDQSIIPTEAALAGLTPVEDVLVVGYPDGIWDSRNNAPIFRRGITATAAYLPFDGETVFLIDCSIFPGSSGSPVFLYNTGGWTDRRGNTALGGVRLLFLGYRCMQWPYTQLQGKW